jgi:signal transduction histidine kinase
MRKFAIVFILAVIAPSLALAWLAVRSLRGQEIVLEHQQTLLYQSVADNLALQIVDQVSAVRRDFIGQVLRFSESNSLRTLSPTFDARLRQAWPLAEIGFVVSLDRQVLAPSPFAGAAARQFRMENERFLCSREAAEVYWNTPKGPVNFSKVEGGKTVKESAPVVHLIPQVPGEVHAKTDGEMKLDSTKSKATRIVVPEKDAPTDAVSRLTAEEAEFQQIVREDTEGTIARFLQNQLKLLLWHRPPCDPDLVFGAQLDLPRLTEKLRSLVRVDESLSGQILVALLDDAGNAVALSRPDFSPATPGVRKPAQARETALFPSPPWKRPVVATEIGEVLPHWEVAVYLLNPSHLSQSARTLRLTLALIVGLLVMAIAVGSWLIVVDLRRHLTLARQKTNFVSNVSHELKTPLTSIRIFSEMLANDRVQDPEKRRQFLNIITAETARLTRLTNNVLDFALLERGERPYHLASCDLGELVTRTVAAYRPHLESLGFKFETRITGSPLPVQADPDALAQVLLNLLSNAEKYSGDRREIEVEVSRSGDEAEIQVLDRGAGVPAGKEEKIFEQFFRANDSLASGIQGSGLGLTLARQIARTHGGDVRYAPREGGGSCFTLRLPIVPASAADADHPASKQPAT